MAHLVTLDDGSKIALPKEYLSFSQINLYLNCPKKYKFRYIDGIKSPPGVALAEGSSGHAAMEMNNLHQIEQGEVLPHEALFERFADEFSDRRKEVEDWTDNTCKDGKADTNQILERAKVYMQTYAEQIAPDMAPTVAEQEHRIKMGGVPLLLYTDTEEKGAVWDYKVSKSNSPYFRAGSAQSSLQLSIYAAATGKKKTGFIGLLKNKPQDYKMVEAVKTPGDIAYATEVIVGVAKAISLGHFPMCGPDNFLCNPKWCGWWSRCRGKLLDAPADKVSVVVPKIKTPARKPKVEVATEMPPPPRKGSRRRK